MDKLKVGLFFGGRSEEHTISVLSAVNIIKYFNPHKYIIYPILIKKSGEWCLIDQSSLSIDPDSLPQSTDFPSSPISMIIGRGKTNFVISENEKTKFSLDIIFPTLHGTFGEDGAIQGLFKIANIPCVGPSILGAAIGMDKDVMKRLLRDAGFSIPRFEVLKTSICDCGMILKKLGSPVFVKPANQGSSLGVSKCNNLEELQEGIKYAFEYDDKIIIEEFIDGDELECYVLGSNEKIMVSVPGITIPTHEFYTYNAKYINYEKTLSKSYRDMSDEIVINTQDLAKSVFKMLCGKGMARIDFFLTKKSKIYVNEINTIPGMIRLSSRPTLWNESGIYYQELIDHMIQNASKL